MLEDDLCNMAVEMGGKTGIVEPDKVTDDFLKDRVKNKYKRINPTPTPIMRRPWRSTPRRSNPKSLAHTLSTTSKQSPRSLAQGSTRSS
jgi:hypothetical protein